MKIDPIENDRGMSPEIMAGPLSERNGWTILGLGSLAWVVLVGVGVGVALLFNVVTSTGMDACQTRHSYDTCAYALLR